MACAPLHLTVHLAGVTLARLAEVLVEMFVPKPPFGWPVVDLATRLMSSTPAASPEALAVMASVAQPMDHLSLLSPVASVSVLEHQCALDFVNKKHI